MDAWVGDERAALADISPTSLATKIRVPVFRPRAERTRSPAGAHREDGKALKAAGVPVEALYVRTEGHGFYAEENRRTYYNRLLFLSRHLGGATAK